ncbi:MAG: carbamoylphosphate synthase large subunit [Bacilli bacterium]|nr:carbamoylphosphate synthase large subunit [Bacilli bacterium]
MKNFVFISPHFPDNFWKFCLALKDRGFNVLGIGDAPFNEISDECKFVLTEYYVCPNMDEFENEVEAVRYFKEKYGPIDYLESNNEYWLEKDAKLREIFDIPHGPYTKQVQYFKKKSLQKEILIKNNIKCADYTLDITKEGLEKFAKKVGFPIFAKPDNGVGAIGTFKMNSSDDIDEFLSKKDDSQYIAEQFIDGKIISFDGICNSHSDLLFFTSHEFSDNISNIVKTGADEMYFCTGDVDVTLEQLGRQVVKAFNLQNRFFHIEFFILNKDHKGLGNKGDYIILEPNMRPAGGYTTDMINYANSLNCYTIYADSIAYDSTLEQPHDKKYFAICSSRRYNNLYRFSDEEIIEKYAPNICMRGVFPKILSSAMGDIYYIAKFNTKEEMFEFDKYVREKNS